MSLNSAEIASVRLPLTKVFVIDFEGLGLDCRWNPSLPIYFGCIITLDTDSRKKVSRHRTAAGAIEHAQKLIADGWVMVAHNAKFELSVMACRGFTHTIVKGELTVADTMVMEYTRNTGLGSYSLASLTGMKTDLLQQLKDDGLVDDSINKKEFWGTDWSGNEQVLGYISNYCVDDCKATLALYQRLCAWYNLPENSKFVSSLLDLEFPVLSVLSHMEVGGIHIDVEALDSLTSDCANELGKHTEALQKVARLLPKLKWDAASNTYVPVSKEYKNSVYKNTGNVRHYIDSAGAITASYPYIVGGHCELLAYNSSAATGHTYWLVKNQCPELLEKVTQTPKGKPKMDKDFFASIAEQLPEELPIAKVLKATKSLQICTSIAKHVVGGRIHGSFNNCLTRTGRLSSSEPNIQNIQRSDKDPASVGSRFRQLFTAPEGKCVLVADLS